MHTLDEGVDNLSDDTIDKSVIEMTNSTSITSTTIFEEQGKSL